MTSNSRLFTQKRIVLIAAWFVSSFAYVFFLMWIWQQEDNTSTFVCGVLAGFMAQSMIVMHLDLLWNKRWEEMKVERFRDNLESSPALPSQ